MNFLCRWCKSWLLRQRGARMTPQLYRVAYAWCHEQDTAAHIVRNALATALADAALLRAPHLLKQQVLFHMVRDHRHRQAARQGATIPVPDRFPPSAGGIAGRVRQALLELSEEQRKIVTLVDLGGCSYREVAAILDLPVRSVVRSLCEIRTRMKERLLNRRALRPAQVVSLEGLR
ncbi:MAG TPA: sigma factor-like helix-turn-helix DNA-binding protein [Gammaproteobacteria bacterium]|nr:sigma factor-like helix-turn-helix DNA-binding protein [Gammaproteobacteria bacterium]